MEVYELKKKSSKVIEPSPIQVRKRHSRIS